MSVPNKQIGWSNEANLLQNILKQIQRLTQVVSNGVSVSYASIIAALGYTPENAAKWTKVYTTSGVGAISDASVLVGSTTFGTDNTAILQTLLNLASASNPITIIWDGKYSVTGLTIKSNTKIIGMPGCGVILRNNSNRPVITNQNFATSATTQTDVNIWIENLIINGNGYNTGTGGNTIFDVANGGSAVNGSAQKRKDPNGVYGLVTCLTLGGVDNVIVRGVQLLGSRIFAGFFINTTNFVFENINVDFGSSSTRDDYNYDGLHFAGPAAYGKINNARFTATKDDCIALIANDVLDPGPYPYGGAGKGNIKDISITNVTLSGAAYGIAMSSTVNIIDRITISGIKGDTKNYFLRIDNVAWIGTANNPGVGIVGVIDISDIEVAVTSSPSQSRNTYTFIDCTIERLNFRNWSRNDFSQSYSLLKTSSNAVINQLNIRGLNIHENASAYNKDLIEITGGTIGVLTVDGAVMNKDTQTNFYNLVKLTGGTVYRLNLNNIAYNNFPNIWTNSGGTLVQVTGNYTNLQSPVFGISGLVQWLDATDPALVVKNSSNQISQLKDRSGNGYTLDQATAGSRPVITSGGQNGLAYASFDGSDDYLERNALTEIKNVATFTQIAVMRRCAVIQGNSATARTGIAYSTSLMYAIISNAGTSYGSYPYSENVPAIHSILYNGGLSGNTARADTYKNITTNTETFTGTIPATTENASTNLRIGRDDGTTYYSGDFYEMLIFNKKLSTTEQALIWGYLNQKYNF